MNCTASREKRYIIDTASFMIKFCIHGTHKTPVKSPLIMGFTNSIKCNWGIHQQHYMQLVNPNPKGRKGLKSLFDQQHISKHIIDRQCYTLFSLSIGLDVVILWPRVRLREQQCVVAAIAQVVAFLDEGKM